MTEFTITIPYEETTWGQVTLTIELPEGDSRDALIDDIVSGKKSAFDQGIVDEYWATSDSEIVEIHNNMLELLDD